MPSPLGSSVTLRSKPHTSKDLKKKRKHTCNSQRQLSSAWQFLGSSVSVLKGSPSTFGVVSTGQHCVCLCNIEEHPYLPSGGWGLWISTLQLGCLFIKLTIVVTPISIPISAVNKNMQKDTRDLLVVQ